MRRILLIARRDYLATIRTKAFLVGLVVSPQEWETASRLASVSAAGIGGAAAFHPDGRTIASAASAGEIDPELLVDLHLLTAKPFVYVFNVDEGALDDEELRAELGALVAPAEAVVVCAQIEAEVAALHALGRANEAAALRARYGFGGGSAA